MQKHFLFLALLLIFSGYSLESMAHTGGHQLSNETQAMGHSLAHLRTWKNTSLNTEIEASFLSFDDKNVALETENHTFVKIPFAHLSLQDQAFVSEKIQYLKSLNHDSSPPVPSGSTTDNLPLLLLISFSGLFVFRLLLKKTKATRIAITATLLPIAQMSCTPVESTQVPVVKSDIKDLEKAFGVFKDTVKTRSDDRYFYVESNGIPEHNMMVGITSWQQQVPLEQSYTGTNAWSIPLQPVLAENPVSTKNNFFRGGIGLAVNGVPIFNALNNRGDDAFLVGELDQWGGHCGRADDYHYHTAPLHLEEKTGSQIPIAYALDGFAVYGSKEPDGSSMTSLDQNNGHFDSQDMYHYHGVKEYPYMIGKMRGEVTKSNDDEITPQPRSTGVREFLEPLRGAEITGFKSTGENAYSLEYTVENQKSVVNYSWDDAGNYTFEFVSADGTSKTETYQRQ